MKPKTLLDLARISNLPTVWSNVLAGAVLGSPHPDALAVVTVGLSGSLLYSGGMFLNDAFDAEIDARERPERPIPSGRIAKSTVLAVGFGLLALALAVLAVLVASARAASGARLVLAGLGVAAAVLVYDRFHKGVALSPVVMGLCRAGLYAMGALAVTPSFGREVALPAMTLLLYVVGLTYVARFENASAVGRIWPTLFVFAPALLVVLRVGWALEQPKLAAAVAVVLTAHVAWSLRSLRLALRGGKGAIPKAVVGLIAGISLVDSAFIALAGVSVGVAAAVTAFGLTLLFQRWVRGT
jgi:4-hydroxybenzoate polyprenyltransferase